MTEERLAWDEYFAAQALLMLAIVPLVNVPKWAQF